MLIINIISINFLFTFLNSFYNNIKTIIKKYKDNNISKPSISFFNAPPIYYNTMKSLFAITLLTLYYLSSL
jgi:hypothetical protein